METSSFGRFVRCAGAPQRQLPRAGAGGSSGPAGPDKKGKDEVLARLPGRRDGDRVRVSDALAGQFDPCYHRACDPYGIDGHPDINATVLSEMSDAVAHAVLTFAQSTSATNGTDKGSSSSTKPYDWKGDHLVR